MKKLILCVLLLNVALLAGRFFHELAARAQGVPVGSENGDTNGDGARDITDAIYLLNWLFLGGPEPVALADSIDLEDRVISLEQAVTQLQGSQPSVEDVAAELAANHAAELRGPVGPPGPAGPAGEGADPREVEFARVTRLSGHADDESPPVDALQPIDCSVENAAVFSLEGKAFGRVVGLRGAEALSSSYALDVVVEDEKGDAVSAAWVGLPASLSLSRASGVRTFHGFVERAGPAGLEGGSVLHSVRIVPPMRRLAHRSGYRIFQDKTVIDIVAQVFADAGLAPPQVDVVGSYVEREFVVQYRESDFDFVSRLLAEEGIYYYFAENDVGDTLVLGDSPAAYLASPAKAYSYYGDAAPPASTGEEYFWSLGLREHVVPSRATLGDYNYLVPDLNLLASAVGVGLGGEVYEFGENTLTRETLDSRAQVHLQRLEVLGVGLEGASNVPVLKPGRKVRVSDVGRRFTGEYVVTEVTHALVPATGESRNCYHYANRISAIPGSKPFRPERVTLKPRAEGVETARVVGPAGEEIYPDEHGRVKVQFHWDREGARDERSSAWIRVAQVAAGSSSNVVWIPEVDDEVIVAFEHGDPDRPVIVGSVFNGNNRPPLALPDNRNVSVLSTRAAEASPELASSVMLDQTRGSEAIEITSPTVSLAALRDLQARADLGMGFVATDMELSATSTLDVQASSARLRADLLEIQSVATSVQGRLLSTSDAGPDTPGQLGLRSRDNAIVAWARIGAGGALSGAEFGVESVKAVETGLYRVVLDASASSAATLIPVVVPAIPAAPRTRSDLRFATLGPSGAQSFDVYVFDGDLQPAAGAFVFMATAR